MDPYTQAMGSFVIGVCIIALVYIVAKHFDNKD